jgi:long-chain acyl-CoA synthetase
MVLKNGVNIYPVEIENEFLLLPGIADAQVTGETDIIKGQQLIARVLLKPGSVFNEAAIRDQLRNRLAGIKVPDKIIEVDGFNETYTGKKTSPPQHLNP